jgi:predicted ATPase
MLTRLSVKNFRLLRDVTIDVEPGKPIVLIGPNSSGKSSVLQVLDLLSRCASVGLEKGLQSLGGGEAVVTADTSEMTVEVDLFRDQSMLRYGFRYTVTSFDYIDGEWLDAYPQGRIQEPIRLLSREDENLWLWNSSEKSKDEQPIDLEEEVDRLSFEFIKQKRLYPELEALREGLAGIQIYDGFLTTPLWSRDAREGRLSPFDSALLSPVPRIDRRGLNLVNALYDLQNNHHEAWDELLDAFRAEFPFVLRLEFPADPAGGRIALGWRDRRYPGERLQGHQMSEGMTSYLCLLAAVLSPAPAAAIAFDEPDAHLHPSAMRRIVHLLEKASERSAVFIATHSDRFLDYLSDPAGSLRICEPGDGGVAVRTLDRDTLDEWRKDYSLLELRERGHLDPANASAVKP